MQCSDNMMKQRGGERRQIDKSIILTCMHQYLRVISSLFSCILQNLPIFPHKSQRDFVIPSIKLIPESFYHPFLLGFRGQRTEIDRWFHFSIFRCSSNSRGGGRRRRRRRRRGRRWNRSGGCFHFVGSNFGAFFRFIQSSTDSSSEPGWLLLLPTMLSTSTMY